MNENWIAVGRLIRARGIRGELIGEVYSSRPGRAEKLKTVMLASGDRERTAEIERVWHHDGRPVFKFAGIDTMTDAEPWAGADVLVPQDQRALPEAGEYSHQDLIGCKVLGCKATGRGEIGGNENARHEIDEAPGSIELPCSETGEQPIGVVTGVQDFGGPPLLVLEGAGGREILVPFVRAICCEIDVEAKIIRAELPAGLLDL